MLKFIKSPTVQYVTAVIAFAAIVVHIFSPSLPEQHKVVQAAEQKKLAMAKPAPKYVPEDDIVMCEGNNKKLNDLCNEINDAYHKINACEKADLAKNPECIAINKKVASYAKK